MVHQYLDSIHALLGALGGFTEMQGAVLAHAPEDFVQDDEGVLQKSKSIRTGLLLGLQGREFPVLSSQFLLPGLLVFTDPDII